MSALAEALTALQSELPVVPKTKTATVRGDKANYSYTYADLADIVPLVYPLLRKLGLSFSSRPTLNASGRFVLAYELLHTSGESRQGEYPLPDPVTQKPQTIGSYITFARRYSLGAVTGLVTDEDDDGRAAAASRKGEGEQEPKRSTGPRTVQRAPATPEPPLSTDGITDAQLGKLQALMREKQMTTRELAQAYIADVIGREVSSSKELTKPEASKVIDALSKEPS